MRLFLVRRICQVFFVLLLLWFAVVATVGTSWWQLRGWPISWLLELAPLTAIATFLATGTLFGNLFWALLVISLTAFLGRFFCGFICPVGAMNQFISWLSRRGQQPLERVTANRFAPTQAIKYYVLIFLLILALLGTVQTGLLDPLPLIYRSLNLALLPLVAGGLDGPRYYVSVWLLGLVFFTVAALNLLRPRFFCRYLCPLGALCGLLAASSPFRIGKQRTGKCGDCRLCEEFCEGACRPSGEIITGECVLCLNCLDRCPTGRITFAHRPSAAGEQMLPDLKRRGLLLAGSGLLLAPLWQRGGLFGNNRDPLLLRPPGALEENLFLARCIRCGQCMRICPANIIQPALLEAGVQGLWSPVINYRLGRSGCQPTCIACGQICPTAAIRPLSVAEKMGLQEFAEQGPIRIGTAFIDRGRCLPWAMERPCLVCQEVCPVSPKAIFPRLAFEIIRDGGDLEAWMFGREIEMADPLPTGVNLASGDYFVGIMAQPELGLRRILRHHEHRLVVEGPPAPSGMPAERVSVDIVVKLERPYVDPSRCIGCGMCERECPVAGQRAIRVFNDNESRAQAGRLLVEEMRRRNTGSIIG
ncbi:MAG: 4Fe-4S binding protein [Desulfobacca sp.]|uniref:4Fe-4S binding protein n=1 Tax=Desulfobacca sp. TaxID=2067990 RepID=UPI00404B03D9